MHICTQECEEVYRHEDRPGLWALLHDAATARLEAIQEILQLATLEVKLNPETVRVDLLWVPATQRSGAAARRAATF